MPVTIEDPYMLRLPFAANYARVIVTDYNAAPTVVFLHKHAWAPLLSVALYLLLILYGPRVMMERK